MLLIEAARLRQAGARLRKSDERITASELACLQQLSPADRQVEASVPRQLVSQAHFIARIMLTWLSVAVLASPQPCQMDQVAALWGKLLAMMSGHRLD